MVHVSGEAPGKIGVMPAPGLFAPSSPPRVGGNVTWKKAFGRRDSQRAPAIGRRSLYISSAPWSGHSWAQES
eukprot:6200891-Pyramimonas_sp.AAC.1